MNLLTIQRALLAPTTSHILLSAKAVGGVFCLLFLFIFSFISVHILKCAKIGFFAHRKANTPPPKKEEKEKAPAPPQEPIYYIVERKRTKTKPKYGEPKEIRFK